VPVRGETVSQEMAVNAAAVSMGIKGRRAEIASV
jgi:hypothetical protein